MKHCLTVSIYLYLSIYICECESRKFCITENIQNNNIGEQVKEIIYSRRGPGHKFNALRYFCTKVA